MIPSIEALRDAIIQWAKTTTSTHNLHVVYVYIKQVIEREQQSGRE